MSANQYAPLRVSLGRDLVNTMCCFFSPPPPPLSSGYGFSERESDSIPVRCLTSRTVGLCSTWLQARALRGGPGGGGAGGRVLLGGCLACVCARFLYMRK